MKNYFQIVKTFLLELGYEISHEDASEGLFVINHEEEGIKNLLVDCDEPILIIEQYLLTLPASAQTAETYRKLLEKNRDAIHGAFVLDETGTKVLFRDTLQLENLDLNELEASINSLKILLAEVSNDLLRMHNA